MEMWKSKYGIKLDVKNMCTQDWWTSEANKYYNILSAFLVKVGRFDRMDPICRFFSVELQTNAFFCGFLPSLKTRERERTKLPGMYEPSAH